MSIFKKEKTIVNVAEGEIVELKNVNDEVFSSGVLGYGYGVIPTQGEVFSPIDGEITNVYDTCHAYSIEGEGIEVLVHIGIDTVELDGEGFSARVKQGDKVKKGSPLAYADLELIKNKGYDTTTVVITPSEIKSPKLQTGYKKAGEKVISYK